MRHVTNDLALFPSANEIVIAVREKGTWIDAVHVRWTDIPDLLAALERTAIEEGQLDELITLQGQLDRTSYELSMCKRHLDYRQQELADWMAFEAEVEARLRALGMPVSAEACVADVVLAWIDRLRAAPTNDSHGI